MYDQKLQEIIELYRMLDIEDVDIVQDVLNIGEVDGRNFFQIEEKNSVISYTSNVMD